MELTLLVGGILTESNAPFAEYNINLAIIYEYSQHIGRPSYNPILTFLNGQFYRTLSRNIALSRRTMEESE